jgi:hypothetical protein
MKAKNFIVGLGCIFTALVFFPWFDSPEKYTHFEDQLKTSLPIEYLFGYPCEFRKDSGPDCYRFGESKAFDGVWIDQFEGSTFIEGTKTVPPVEPSYEQTAWLHTNRAVIAKALDGQIGKVEHGCEYVRAFHLRFIGRERPGPGGHFDLWPRVIWLERVIEAKPLPITDCTAY